MAGKLVKASDLPAISVILPRRAWCRKCNKVRDSWVWFCTVTPDDKVVAGTRCRRLEGRHDTCGKEGVMVLSVHQWKSLVEYGEEG